MSFTDKHCCRSQAHCRTCRDQQGGSSWRAAVGAPDDCPQGHPWGYVPPADAKPVPPVVDDRQQAMEELADERRAVCKQGCEHFSHLPGLGRCTLQHPDEQAACPCAAWYREPASRCPKEPPAWTEAEV